MSSIYLFAMGIMIGVENMKVVGLHHNEKFGMDSEIEGKGMWCMVSAWRSGWE